MVYRAKGMGRKISRDIYAKTSTQLTDALIIGLGGDSFAFDAPTNLLKAKLESNIHAFSAAKSLAQYQVMSEAMTDENGKLRTFNMFREAVEKINPLFNEQWLKAEYENALAQAESAIAWEGIQANKKIFSWLRYVTQEDDRVRPEHWALHDIKRPVEDPFWKTYFPPNGWGCRCKALPEDYPRGQTKERDAASAGEKANVAELFRNNPGETAVIFKDDHPYYQSVPGKTSALEAEKNYGMKNWKQMHNDMKDYAPATPAARSQKEYTDWWKDMVTKYGTAGSSWAIPDKMGNQVLFDAPAKGYSKNMFRDAVKDRHEYATEAGRIIQQPDELWSHYDVDSSNPLQYAYLKYYNDSILTVIVKERDGMLKAETIYEVATAEIFKDLRKGVLIHANRKF